MKSNHCILLTLITGAALVLGGCGKSEAPATAAAATDVRVVEITANDTMKFNVVEIHAQSGEKLRISMTNLGRMPKQAMAHNWVLLTPMSDADVTAFSMAVASRAPDYLPEDRSKILAHLKLLGPNENDTIEITAPSAPGEYPYICSFPGHATFMRGKLIVGPAKS